MAAEKIARVVWTLPALADLDVIADYIALDNPGAADRLVKKVFSAVDRIEYFPRLGRRVPEFPTLPFRELIVPPCRVLYRLDGNAAVIVLVIRGEQFVEEHMLWRWSNN